MTKTETSPRSRDPMVHLTVEPLALQILIAGPINRKNVSPLGIVTVATTLVAVLIP